MVIFISEFNVVTRFISRFVFNPFLIDKYVFPDLYCTPLLILTEKTHSWEDTTWGHWLRFFLKDRISKSQLILWQIDWQESCRLHFINRIHCFALQWVCYRSTLWFFITLGYNIYIHLDVDLEWLFSILLSFI